MLFDFLVIITKVYKYVLSMSNLFFSGLFSWTAGSSDYFQYLTVNLRRRKIIHLIATQGQVYTKEFVSEYCIQYSNDGDTWRTYVAADGSAQV